MRLFQHEDFSSIAADYDEQCRTLCYGPYPSFDEVIGRFEEMRSLL